MEGSRNRARRPPGVAPMTEPSLPEESLFALALDVPAGDRAAFLDRACAGRGLLGHRGNSAKQLI